MITTTNQRWRRGRGSYRPAGELITTADYEVAAIEQDSVAKAFVQAHHYSGTYPSARFRFGLYHHNKLVGVSVFSVPVNKYTLSNCLPGEPIESVELGRFVLLDDVPGNGETWFLARCFAELRSAGIIGVVSFSDPMPRETADGGRIFAGHVGTIYQAHNAVYIGQARKDTMRLLPDAKALSPRSVAKVRKLDKGHVHVERLIVSYGADERGDGCPRLWLDHWLPRITRKVRHPGNHKYVWALNKRTRKHLPAGRPYPKMDLAA